MVAAGSALTHGCSRRLPRRSGALAEVIRHLLGQAPAIEAAAQGANFQSRVAKDEVPELSEQVATDLRLDVPFDTGETRREFCCHGFPISIDPLR